MGAVPASKNIFVSTPINPFLVVTKDFVNTKSNSGRDISKVKDYFCTSALSCRLRERERAKCECKKKSRLYIRPSVIDATKICRVLSMMLDRFVSPLLPSKVKGIHSIPYLMGPSA